MRPPVSITFRPRSQAGQDRWIYELFVQLNGLPAASQGTFLDIGCHHPQTINNTIALEELGWRGLCVDIQAQFAPYYESLRKSLFLAADARIIDWTDVVTELCSDLASLRSDPTRFDYLSLDVDESTVATLENLIAHGVRFRAATIEHDSYKAGHGPRDTIRKLMTEQGYTLRHPDVNVMCDDGVLRAFEDWWVDERTLKETEVVKCERK